MVRIRRVLLAAVSASLLALSLSSTAPAATGSGYCASLSPGYGCYFSAQLPGGGLARSVRSQGDSGPTCAGYATTLGVWTEVCQNFGANGAIASNTYSQNWVMGRNIAGWTQGLTLWWS